MTLARYIQINDRSERLIKFFTQQEKFKHSYLLYKMKKNTTLEKLHKLSKELKEIFIDPGGKGGHGIAAAVVVINKGLFCILKLKVIRGGALEAAEWLLKSIPIWNIRVWGVEGNYSQKETYCDVIERELYNMAKEKGLEDLYTGNQGESNKGDKINCIDGVFSVRLGRDGHDKTFYVNPKVEDFEQFMNEFSQFPIIHHNFKHEFDLLDCCASIDIHLSILGGGFWFGGGSKAEAGYEEI